MRAWVKVVNTLRYSVPQYLSHVMMPGRRRCPQIRGPDKGGSTAGAYPGGGGGGGGVLRVLKHPPRARDRVCLMNIVCTLS